MSTAGWFGVAHTSAICCLRCSPPTVPPTLWRSRPSSSSKSLPNFCRWGRRGGGRGDNNRGVRSGGGVEQGVVSSGVVVHRLGPSSSNHLPHLLRDLVLLLLNAAHGVDCCLKSRRRGCLFVCLFVEGGVVWPKQHVGVYKSSCIAFPPGPQ